MEKIKQYFNAENIKGYLANTPQITFEITDLCNLDCVYCGYGKLYNDYDTREHKLMHAEDAKVLLSYLIDLWASPLNKSANSNVYISFYGGEPLLNLPFIKAIVNFLKNEAKCSTRTFTFSITTNATLLDKHMDFMVEHNFNILISIDGDENCNSYRVDKGGNNSFDRIVRNIDKLRDKYPDYFGSNVNFNAVLHNRNSVQKIFDFFKETYTKIPSIGELSTSGIREEMKSDFLNMYANSTESLFQSENYSDIEMDMFLKSPTYHSATVYVLQHSEFKYNNYNELLYGKPSIDYNIPTGTCLPFSKKVFVTVNGKLLPCERIGHQFALGKITEAKIVLDFEAIAEKYNRYYAKLDNQCSVCNIRGACMQCIYNLPCIENEECNCYGFMNKESFMSYEKTQLGFLARNPEAYARIMNEVIMK